MYSYTRTNDTATKGKTMAHSSASQAPALAPVEDDRAPHILVARYRKARAVAKTLLALGASKDDAIALGETEVGRALAAKAADVNVPSTTSWALVVELVAEVRP